MLTKNIFGTLKRKMMGEKRKRIFTFGNEYYEGLSVF